MPILGKVVGTGEEIELTADARRQGVYIIGTTGTGKTTLLQNIAYEDMLAGDGLCVLDPHGDLTDELLSRVPKERWDDVILFDPMDLERPFGLNLLDCNRSDPHQVRWVLSTVIGTLQRLFAFSWGPRLEHVLRHSLLTAMSLEDDATLVEVLLLLTSPEFLELILPQLEDPFLLNFWSSFPRSERLRFELTGSTLNKISPFLTDWSIRNIVGQPKNSFDMQSVMDEGKILLINLSKGDLGEDNSSLLGSVLVNLILIGALRRRTIPFDRRKPFHLIVDEFQNFATESFAVLQSEARKYAVDVIVAHQFRDQLDELSRGSTLNAGNFIVLRVSGKDGLELASQYDNTPPPPDTRMEPRYRQHSLGNDDQGQFVTVNLPTGEGRLYHEVEQPRRPYSDVQMETANTLSLLPNFQARGRLIEGNNLQEYHIETLKEKGEADAEATAYIRENSRQKYGRDRKAVEADILRRVGAADDGESLFPVSIFSK